MKKIGSSILAVLPPVLTLVLALVSWDSFLRMISAGMEGVTGEETQNLSQYESAGVWLIIIPLFLAALGVAMLNLKNNKGKIIKIIGGLLIVASCITSMFNGFMIAGHIKNPLVYILVALELLAAITGIVLLSKKTREE